ncbi:uncharacterized protein PODANS_6_6980 [Podospora anserina S mat+]|uniref:Podospora anserina S mat+ genomic DNA chromosome 6, supercontig 2 n=1 Tax=Podospora anserina (strain S / ATCC MYA-4624 / DSM 980 / FGSC 10383) TaxID=515849 RepID=B2B3R0_PODAN|nr:uncharacterized protein PODANS_6_6980 [Podospora anserina S mat+]CAP71746.1 unnamed protein product [Podospora anserina S mat+]CDP31137.1 Putative protein of unknown function [Podospora anserina S mat+]
MPVIPNLLLLREWLQHCDNNHDCPQKRGKGSFWPKRIIFVGDSDPKKLSLVENQSLDEDYLVLSHRWGNPTEDEKRQFCNTKENRRLKDFFFEQLPKTFQDTVQITRALGKQYLWIDALCIIQGDGGDWKSQANTMQNIFANAYCTIAVTSAHNWKDGFLKSQSRFSDDGAQNTLASSACQCHFDEDVDAGPLMQRAWVLQERVLSRRTIHFTTSHVYCECGDGVICERLTKLIPPFGKEYFILDPHFLDRLWRSGYYRTIEFIQFLFQKYSTSGLTDETDRVIAIHSLVERMEKVVQSKAKYGIFRFCLGSLLLWKRTEEQKPLIKYDDDQVPSWSWMAYSGGIEFILDPNPSFRVPRFEDLDFADDRSVLNVKVRNFGGSCRMGQNEEKYVILDGEEEVGSLWFDIADQIRFEDCNCVIVGALDAEMKDHKVEDARKGYYMIIVQKEDGDRGYKRVGVGIVRAQYVSEECISSILR